MAAAVLKSLALIAAVLVQRCHALDNGLALTPPMGYNSWYDLMCSPYMNETTLERTADAMIAKGLFALGYEYLNLDDCYIKSRDSSGVLQPDPKTFSKGMKSLGDYAHSKGMKFGVYTDRGTETCGGRPAAQGHEIQDAKTYASWGVDYLKEDSCHASSDHATAFKQYGAMRDALNATGRPILFSLCGWNAWYAPVGKTLGNAWRTGPDDSNWNGVIKNIDILAPLSEDAGPGGWNDPCLLLSQDWSGKMIMTELQIKAQFSMWAVVSAPLLISGSVINMTPETLATYSNKKVIAVNQDPLGKAGTRVAGGDMSACHGKTANCTNVWAKPLSTKATSMVFINTGNAPAKVEDLWSNDVSQVTVNKAGPMCTTSELPAEGGVQMISVTM